MLHFFGKNISKDFDISQFMRNFATGKPSMANTSSAENTMSRKNHIGI